MSYKANESAYRAGYNHKDAKPIALCTSGETGDVSRTLEGFEAKFGNVGSTSGVTPWGVGRTNNVVKIEALEFGGKNVLTLVSARSWSGPSGNFGAASLVGQGVFGFDVVDGLPSDGGSVERIHHNDTFVEDFDLRVDESQPSECSNGCAQTSHAQGQASTRVENRLDQVQGIQQDHEHTHENSGFWSENVSIGHLPIVAGDSGIPMVEGK
jgi:hypothetical protein